MENSTLPSRRRGCLRLSLWTSGAILAIALILILIFRPRIETSRIQRIGTWFDDPSVHETWEVTVGTRCGDAPMIVPTTGYIGVGWDDGARPMYRHTGYDIFSPHGGDNITPIIAAYDGYLTRESSWLSSVIIRHPGFPEIVDGEQIWTYYTHMANADGTVSFVDEAFPRGTRELFVTAGTLLGYQGTWSGTVDRPVGLHLHFSIVDSIGIEGYANETRIQNTYDPAPFLGFSETEEGIIRCNDASQAVEGAHTALNPNR